MTVQTTDIIARLSGIPAGSSLDRALANRPDARANAQASHDLLLSPADPGPVSLTERRAVAVFVASLSRDLPVVAHYRGLLAQSDTTEGQLPHALLWEAERALGPGPWGSYPLGPLSAEDTAGTVFAVSDENRDVLGDRLTAALEHAHLLVLHPRDASQAALERLLAAGWTTAGIVTLSQLVAFLSFQIRVIAGLRTVHTARQSARIPA